MDILPRHIEYLLTRHDCVIVPGIGAFIVTETEASIDFDNGLIIPRRRDISFNSSVVTDDGLLAHSIARAEHLSYESAHRQLSLLVARMKSDLETEGEVSLGMVGRLRKDSEGYLAFEPRHSAAMIDLCRNIRINITSHQESAALEPETVSFSEPLVEEDGSRLVRVSPDHYFFTISKRAVRAAAMVIAILTVGISLLIPINHDNEQKASVISIENLFQHTVKPHTPDNNIKQVGDSIPSDSIKGCSEDFFD